MEKKLLILLTIGFLFAASLVNAEQILKAGTVDKLPGFEIENGVLKTDPLHQEFIENIEKELDIKLVWSSYPTIRLLKMTKRGDIDMIWPMGFSKERDAYLIRSIPTESSEDYIVYVKKPANLEDTSLTVACKQGSPQENYLIVKGYKPSTVEDYDALFMMLVAGRVDSILLPRQLYNELIPKYQDKGIDYEVFVTRAAGFYFPKSLDKKLINKINEAVEKYNDIFE